MIPTVNPISNWYTNQAGWSVVAASSGIARTYAGCGSKGAVRIPAPTIAPSSSRTTSHHWGKPRGGSTPAWRSRTARSAMVATTVLRTGSAARCSPAMSRKPAASSRKSSW